MRIYIHLAIILSILTVISGQESKPCRARTFDQDSVVCVCNEDYCDEFGPIDLSSDKGQNVVHVIESNRNGFRFHHEMANMSQQLPYGFLNQFDVKIAINRTEKNQTVEGFGGTFVDAAGMTTYSLPPKAAQKIIESYFTPNGLDYSICRVVIGSSDFSHRPYTLDDYPTDDFNLDHFSFQEEDYKYKIRMIRDAVRTSKRPIKFFASAWSAPHWMNYVQYGHTRFKGHPGGPYYKAWAKYQVKFLDAFKKENITFWGMTTGEEPIDGFYSLYKNCHVCIGMTPDEQRDWIKMDLGPLLEETGYGRDKLKVMIMDDQRETMPLWAIIVLSDPETAKYVDGIAFHWYGNHLASPTILERVHQLYPEKFIMATEQSITSLPKNVHPKLGKWVFAEIYAVDIIEDFLNWNVAWVDWSFSLDTQGGPNWAKNWIDCPIIVNAASGEFYKQPHYYALGHFSKFVPPGSKVVNHSIDAKRYKVISVSFETPHNTTTTVVVNQEETPKTVEVLDVITNNRFDYRMSPRSIVTFLTAN